MERREGEPGRDERGDEGVERTCVCMCVCGEEDGSGGVWGSWVEEEEEEEKDKKKGGWGGQKN